ncbi:MAG: N-acetyl-alpha-D-glucosaminyl L-malate synthase BshA [Gemmatimonadales bacterium]|nr:MAG: N-acetyl-alpha-D-glucosaminyl L-malate synthase BshA [Gemmatimonadales bacterium]
MKIGITCYPTYGGSGAVATELGIQLADRGHEVHFISYAQPFRLTTFHDRLFYHEVDIHTYPLFEYPPYSLSLAVQIHAVALKQDLDLLHAHYAIPHATAAWIAKEMLRHEGRDLPIATTLHGTDITLVGQDPAFWSITKFSVERSDGLTAVSNYLRTETLEAFNCPRCDIEVIPNFVDPAAYDRTRYDCNTSTLAPRGEKIVMHISNFRKVKRIGDVVRIYARIRERLPARLVLVGDGPERNTAMELAEELGVAEDVCFLGKLETVAELLACADLLLLPSEQESFGLVALEAMSSGTPVIGTEGSGLSEVVEHGRTGFLHPVGEVEAMAQSGVRLLEDPALWREFSNAARDRAVSTFSADRIVPLYEDFYERIIQRSKDRSRVGT